MSKEKTEKQIKAELERLYALKENPKFPKVTIFGDDNIEKLDAQILVLEEGMDESAVYDKWQTRDEDGEETEEGMDIISNALESVKWRESEKGAEAPSRGWSVILKK